MKKTVHKLMRYIRVLLPMLITQMFILSCGQLRVNGSQNPIVSTTPTPIIDSIPTETQISNSESINSLGNTLKTDMIFNVETIVHYICQFMTLEAGDIISTGTPAGLSAARGAYRVSISHASSPCAPRRTASAP